MTVNEKPTEKIIESSKEGKKKITELKSFADSVTPKSSIVKEEIKPKSQLQKYEKSRPNKNRPQTSKSRFKSHSNSLRKSKSKSRPTSAVKQALKADPNALKKRPPTPKITSNSKLASFNRKGSNESCKQKGMTDSTKFLSKYLKSEKSNHAHTSRKLPSIFIHSLGNTGLSSSQSSTKLKQKDQKKYSRNYFSSKLQAKTLAKESSGGFRASPHDWSKPSKFSSRPISPTSNVK